MSTRKRRLAVQVGATDDADLFDLLRGRPQTDRKWNAPSHLSPSMSAPSLEVLTSTVRRGVRQLYVLIRGVCVIRWFFRGALQTLRESDESKPVRREGLEDAKIAVLTPKCRYETGFRRTFTSTKKRVLLGSVARLRSRSCEYVTMNLPRASFALE
jgi:hypothetical protein